MKVQGETNIEPLIEQALENLSCKLDALEWWSWPEVFGSTAGPRGGIGGQTVTTFQVFGFWDDASDTGILYCSGFWRPWRNFPQLRWQR